MSADTTVEQIMRAGSLRLSPTMPIREAVALFIRQRIPSAPVIDETGALAGILTEKDCFGPMLKASYYQQWEGTVASYMSRSVLTLPADLDLVSAAEEFLARSHRVYPVMRDGDVVGMLHRSDLFAAILDLAEPVSR